MPSEENLGGCVWCVSHELFTLQWHMQWHSIYNPSTSVGHQVTHLIKKYVNRKLQHASSQIDAASASASTYTSHLSKPSFVIDHVSVTNQAKWDQD